MDWVAHGETFVGHPCDEGLLFVAVAAAVEPSVVADAVVASDAAAFAVEVEVQEVLAVPFLVVDPSVVVAAACQVY